jgi:enoyl-CoA hydratase/carnithine racemase
MNECFAVARVGHVATVTFERAPNNFVDTGVLSALADALEGLDEEPGCRVVVLQANGKVFCAGANLEGAPQSGAQIGEAAPSSVNSLYVQAVRLHATRKPIVVAVQGAAIGAGLGLALIGDFRVAAEEARFAANFVKLGFHPGFGLTDTLPELVGRQTASMLMLTARRIDAKTALAYGLVDQVTTAEQLRETAFALATEISENAPLAIQATRATLRANLAERVRRATQHEWDEQRRLIRTEDFAEGVKAMTERRVATFHGR